MPALLRRLLPDRFILLLLSVVAAATLLPARGEALRIAEAASTAAIVTLFFLHGVRTSLHAVIDGFRNWRLQLAIFGACYGVLGLLGWGTAALLAGAVGPSFALGFLFLGVLPTTVQSSIAYTSIARGNVAAAVIAAAAVNIAGVVLTPALFALLASVQGAEAGLGGIGRIASILLLPFALGQLARRWLMTAVERRRAIVGVLDKLTIVLAVYVAFSEAAAEGLWSSVAGSTLALLLAGVVAMLGAGFGLAWALGGSLGLPRPDRATLLFSGAHKSLVTGAPMARILFPGAEAGAVLLPLILYHQLQLMLSALIAPRLAARAQGGEPGVLRA